MFGVFNKRPDSPWNLCLGESFHDLQSSLILAFGGYYREATALLRGVLELSLRAYYADLRKEKLINVERLEVSRILREKKVKGTLNSAIYKEIKRLNTDLNNYVHSKIGATQLLLQVGKALLKKVAIPLYFPIYDKNAFSYWAKYFEKTAKALVYLTIRSHPQLLYEEVTAEGVPFDINEVLDDFPQIKKTMYDKEGLRKKMPL